MTGKWPKVTARRRTRVSPWMAIIEREVEFAPGAMGELYHAVDQRDYVAIVAQLVTPVQLAKMIQAGEFALQLHVGALLLAGMQGFISLEAFQR